MKLFNFLVWTILGSTAALAQTAPEVTQPVAQNPTLWDLVVAGGWAMVPLGFLSILATALVLIFMVTLRKRNIVSAHFMSTADALFRKRDYLGLLAIANRHREAVARVIHRTLDFVTKNPNAPFEVVREIAQSEGSKVSAAMNQRIIYLADIGMLAPMLGLLGTVFGIIRSFGTIGSGAARQGTRDVLLAAGVSEALVATSAGLIIGITSMAFYGLFRGRVQNLISELESATAHALALLALNYRKVAPTKSNVLVEEEY